MTIPRGGGRTRDRLIDIDVLPRLETRSLGRRLHVYRTVDSTNGLLRGEAFWNAPAGTVIAAEEQRKGRGRLDRVWEAPPFRALLFSVLIEPRGGTEEAALANLVAALAVADAVADGGGPSLRIRWPNDLVADDRKVCGILSEYRSDRGALVIGIGLNVNQEKGELPPAASSLRTITGRAFVRAPLLAGILNRLEAHLDELGARGFEPLRARIEERSSLPGRTVTLDLGGGRTLIATAIGIGPSGGLVVSAPDGPREVLAGEVTRVLSSESDS
ncbi:MAG: biotin--[acetyl-CoA-carboxylase] ligase [Candidatus Eisenbacteria bacterium]